jgi:hypothetical protein
MTFKKITLGGKDPFEITKEELEAAEAAGLIQEATEQEAHETFANAKEIVLTDAMLKDLEELGITPDEFIASLLKQTGNVS